MGISSLVGRILPAATAFVTSGGNPVAAAASFVAADQARDNAKKVRLQNEIATNRYRENLNMMGSGEFGTPGLNFQGPVPNRQVGFFERLGNIGSSVGNTLLTGLESAIPSVINRQIFGGSRPQSASQGPALTTITNVGAQESQGSGTIEAGVGSLLPSLVSGARGLLKSPAGQLALGTGAGAALSFMSPDGKRMRITRKMKSQARTVLNIAGGNISVAADILNISDEMLITILLKRFRNDGPVVTKAALRKTKSTIRRLHSMQDVLKSITPTAAGRRRTPMKRAMSTTLIKN
tara:strand:+ start:1188 stop:2066 length:879 start_codon:yes stop_codon:yes gene_type:complete